MSARHLIPALTLLGATACETVPVSDPPPGDIRYIASDALKQSGFPLSTAVEADGWIFLSGALGTVPGEGLVPGGIGPETTQTMDNIKATLEAEGLGMDRVVKCLVMLADIDEWQTFNEIYKTYFDDDYPARSAFGASGLALGARVEVECIARR
ncbi:MAG: RidA family protein [Pseudomonadota bacterium]